MKTFFDSSAFAKPYINEAGSEMVERLRAEAEEVALCVICPLEIVAALARLRREARLDADECRKIRDTLFRDMKVVAILDLTPAVIQRAISLLEEFSLRAMDSLHVACALECRADLFVSSDKRQLGAARGAGLETMEA